jgi:predicted DNA-binding protein
VGKTEHHYKRTTIRLKDEEYEVLRYLAFNQKTSVAGVVRRLISELVEEQEDIRDGLKALQEQSGSLDWQSFKREKLDL